MGILFIAANLRAPITGRGPLVGYIHSQTHLSNTITGLLSALPLLVFFGLRTKDSKQAAELSGMAQSVGNLLAAAGPILFGFLHDVTHA